MSAASDGATGGLRESPLSLQRRVPKWVPRRAPKEPWPPHSQPKPPMPPKKSPGPPRRRLPVRPPVDCRIEYAGFGVREEPNT
jgi:hypothetical protein